MTQTTLRNFFLIFLFFLIGLASSVVFLIFKSTVSQNFGMQYTVQTGATIQSVEADLQSQQIISHPFLLRFLVLMHGKNHRLHSGEYLFVKGSSPYRIVHQLMTGTGLVQHPFTIIEGWNFKQIRNALNNEPLLQHYTQGLTDTEIMKSLGLNVNPEGQFFPDTYFYTYGYSDLILLKRAYKKMQSHLTTAWNSRSANLPFKNSYEALIAASLVEKEAHASEERPIIAGVLINRLRKNMRLQFDPTVIYAMGNAYSGTIYKKDLISESPYNTYMHEGLPPTPIASPSLSSINAVMHPDNNDYLYFVAKGDGHHEFTSNLSAHHEAVSNAKITVKQRPFFNSTLVKEYLGQK